MLSLLQSFGKLHNSLFPELQEILQTFLSTALKPLLWIPWYLCLFNPWFLQHLMMSFNSFFLLIHTQLYTSVWLERLTGLVGKLLTCSTSWPRCP